MKLEFGQFNKAISGAYDIKLDESFNTGCNSFKGTVHLYCKSSVDDSTIWIWIDYKTLIKLLFKYTILKIKEIFKKHA